MYLNERHTIFFAAEFLVYSMQLHALVLVYPEWRADNDVCDKESPTTNWQITGFKDHNGRFVSLLSLLSNKETQSTMC